MSTEFNYPGNDAAVLERPSLSDTVLRETLLHDAPSTILPGSEETVRLIAVWNGQQFVIDARLTDTVSQVKGVLAGLTNVLPKRQKIVGFVKGKLPADEVILQSLKLKNDQKFILMGTPEIEILNPEYLDLPEVLNDFDLDYAAVHDVYINSEKNKKKLDEIIQKTEIRFINSPRTGKKLLVLDLDYTIFDCKSTASRVSELMRPGTHELLVDAYQNYDIVIWSQTSWKVLEMKVTEMGLLTHPLYKIMFVLDYTSMFSVTGRKHGKPYKHQVKALGMFSLKVFLFFTWLFFKYNTRCEEGANKLSSPDHVDVIWKKLSNFYSAENTVHIDDLSRNFAMNPQSGLKIPAFKNAPVTRSTDKHLYKLARYLRDIAEKGLDFKTIDHAVWCFHPDGDTQSTTAI